MRFHSAFAAFLFTLLASLGLLPSAARGDARRLNMDYEAMCAGAAIMPATIAGPGPYVWSNGLDVPAAVISLDTGFSGSHVVICGGAYALDGTVRLTIDGAVAAAREQLRSISFVPLADEMKPSSSTGHMAAYRGATITIRNLPRLSVVGLHGLRLVDTNVTVEDCDGDAEPLVADVQGLFAYTSSVVSLQSVSMEGYSSLRLRNLDLSHAAFQTAVAATTSTAAIPRWALFHANHTNVTGPAASIVIEDCRHNVTRSFISNPPAASSLGAVAVRHSRLLDGGQIHVLRTNITVADNVTATLAVPGGTGSPYQWHAVCLHVAGGAVNGTFVLDRSYLRSADVAPVQLLHVSLDNVTHATGDGALGGTLTGINVVVTGSDLLIEPSPLFVDAQYEALRVDSTGLLENSAESVRVAVTVNRSCIRSTKVYRRNSVRLVDVVDVGARIAVLDSTVALLQGADYSTYDNALIHATLVERSTPQSLPPSVEVARSTLQYTSLYSFGSTVGQVPIPNLGTACAIFASLRQSGPNASSDDDNDGVAAGWHRRSFVSVVDATVTVTAAYTELVLERGVGFHVSGFSDTVVRGCTVSVTGFSSTRGLVHMRAPTSATVVIAQNNVSISSFYTCVGIDRSEASANGSVSVSGNRIAASLVNNPNLLPEQIFAVTITGRWVTAVRNEITAALNGTTAYVRTVALHTLAIESASDKVSDGMFASILIASNAVSVVGRRMTVLYGISAEWQGAFSRPRPHHQANITVVGNTVNVTDDTGPTVHQRGDAAVRLVVSGGSSRDSLAQPHLRYALVNVSSNHVRTNAHLHAMSAGTDDQSTMSIPPGVVARTLHATSNTVIATMADSTSAGGMAVVGFTQVTLSRLTVTLSLDGVGLAAGAIFLVPAHAQVQISQVVVDVRDSAHVSVVTAVELTLRTISSAVAFHGAVEVRNVSFEHRGHAASRSQILVLSTPSSSPPNGTARSHTDVAVSALRTVRHPALARQLAFDRHCVVVAAAVTIHLGSELAASVLVTNVSHIDSGGGDSPLVGNCAAAGLAQCGASAYGCDVEHTIGVFVETGSLSRLDVSDLAISTASSFVAGVRMESGTEVDHFSAHRIQVTHGTVKETGLHSPPRAAFTMHAVIVAGSVRVAAVGGLRARGTVDVTAPVPSTFALAVFAAEDSASDLTLSCVDSVGEFHVVKRANVSVEPPALHFGSGGVVVQDRVLRSLEVSRVSIAATTNFQATTNATHAGGTWNVAVVSVFFRSAFAASATEQLNIDIRNVSAHVAAPLSLLATAFVVVNGAQMNDSRRLPIALVLDGLYAETVRALHIELVRGVCRRAAVERVAVRVLAEPVTSKIVAIGVGEVDGTVRVSNLTLKFPAADEVPLGRWASPLLEVVAYAPAAPAAGESAGGSGTFVVEDVVVACEGPSARGWDAAQLAIRGADAPPEAVILSVVDGGALTGQFARFEFRRVLVNVLVRILPDGNAAHAFIPRPFKLTGVNIAAEASREASVADTSVTITVLEGGAHAATGLGDVWCVGMVALVRALATARDLALTATNTVGPAFGANIALAATSDVSFRRVVVSVDGAARAGSALRTAGVSVTCQRPAAFTTATAIALSFIELAELRIQQRSEAAGLGLVFLGAASIVRILNSTVDAHWRAGPADSAMAHAIYFVNPAVPLPREVRVSLDNVSVRVYGDVPAAMSNLASAIRFDTGWPSVSLSHVNVSVEFSNATLSTMAGGVHVMNAAQASIVDSTIVVRSPLPAPGLVLQSSGQVSPMNTMLLLRTRVAVHELRPSTARGGASSDHNVSVAQLLTTCSFEVHVEDVVLELRLFAASGNAKHSWNSATLLAMPAAIISQDLLVTNCNLTATSDESGPIPRLFGMSFGTVSAPYLRLTRTAIKLPTNEGAPDVHHVLCLHDATFCPPLSASTGPGLLVVQSQSHFDGGRFHAGAVGSALILSSTFTNAPFAVTPVMVLAPSVARIVEVSESTFVKTTASFGPQPAIRVDGTIDTFVIRHCAVSSTVGGSAIEIAHGPECGRNGKSEVSLSNVSIAAELMESPSHAPPRSIAGLDVSSAAAHSTCPLHLRASQVAVALTAAPHHQRQSTPSAQGAPASEVRCISATNAVLMELITTHCILAGVTASNRVEGVHVAVSGRRGDVKRFPVVVDDSAIAIHGCTVLAAAGVVVGARFTTRTPELTTVFELQHTNVSVSTVSAHVVAVSVESVTAAATAPESSLPGLVLVANSTRINVSSTAGGNATGFLLSALSLASTDSQTSLLVENSDVNVSASGGAAVGADLAIGTPQGQGPWGSVENVVVVVIVNLTRVSVHGASGWVEGVRFGPRDAALKLPPGLRPPLLEVGVLNSELVVVTLTRAELPQSGRSAVGVAAWMDGLAASRLRVDIRSSVLHVSGSAAASVHGISVKGPVTTVGTLVHDTAITLLCDVRSSDSGHDPTQQRHVGCSAIEQDLGGGSAQLRVFRAIIAVDVVGVAFPQDRAAVLLVRYVQDAIPSDAMAAAAARSIHVNAAVMTCVGPVGVRCAPFVIDAASSYRTRNTLRMRDVALHVPRSDAPLVASGSSDGAWPFYSVSVQCLRPSGARSLATEAEITALLRRSVSVAAGARRDEFESTMRAPSGVVVDGCLEPCRPPMYLCSLSPSISTTKASATTSRSLPLTPSEERGFTKTASLPFRPPQLRLSAGSPESVSAASLVGGATQRADGIGTFAVEIIPPTSAAAADALPETDRLRPVGTACTVGIDVLATPAPDTSTAAAASVVVVAPTLEFRRIVSELLRRDASTVSADIVVGTADGGPAPRVQFFLPRLFNATAIGERVATRDTQLTTVQRLRNGPSAAIVRLADSFPVLDAESPSSSNAAFARWLVTHIAHVAVAPGRSCFERRAIVAGSNATAFALTPPPPREPPTVPAAVEATAIGASLASGLAGGSPTGAAAAARTSLIARLSQCEREVGDPLDVSVSPTGVAIWAAGEDAAYHAGAVVMNTMLIAACALPLLAYGAWMESRTITKLNQKAAADDGDDGPESFSWACAARLGRLPSLLVFPLMFLLQPVMGTAMISLLFGAGGAAIAIGLGGLLWTSAFCVLAWRELRRDDMPAVFIPDAPADAHADGADGGDAEEGLYGRLSSWIDGVRLNYRLSQPGKWRDVAPCADSATAIPLLAFPEHLPKHAMTHGARPPHTAVPVSPVTAQEAAIGAPKLPPRESYIRGMLLFIADYHGGCRWFFLVELATTALLAVCEAAMEDGGCAIAGLGILAVFTVYMLAVLRLRPHESLVNFGMTISVAFLQWSAAILALLAASADNDGIEQQALELGAEALLALALLATTVRGVYDVTRMVLQVVRSRASRSAEVRKEARAERKRREAEAKQAKAAAEAAAAEEAERARQDQAARDALREAAERAAEEQRRGAKEEQTRRRRDSLGRSALTLGSAKERGGSLDDPPSPSQPPPPPRLRTAAEFAESSKNRLAQLRLGLELAMAAEPHLAEAEDALRDAVLADRARQKAAQAAHTDESRRAQQEAQTRRQAGGGGMPFVVDPRDL